MHPEGEWHGVRLGGILWKDEPTGHPSAVGGGGFDPFEAAGHLGVLDGGAEGRQCAICDIDRDDLAGAVVVRADCIQDGAVGAELDVVEGPMLGEATNLVRLEVDREDGAFAVLVGGDEQLGAVRRESGGGGPTIPLVGDRRVCSRCDVEEHQATLAGLGGSAVLSFDDGQLGALRGEQRRPIAQSGSVRQGSLVAARDVDDHELRVPVALWLHDAPRHGKHRAITAENRILDGGTDVAREVPDVDEFIVLEATGPQASLLRADVMIPIAHPCRGVQDRVDLVLATRFPLALVLFIILRAGVHRDSEHDHVALIRREHHRESTIPLRDREGLTHDGQLPDGARGLGGGFVACWGKVALRGEQQLAFRGDRRQRFTLHRAREALGGQRAGRVDLPDRGGPFRGVMIRALDTDDEALTVWAQRQVPEAWKANVGVEVLKRKVEGIIHALHLNR